MSARSIDVPILYAPVMVFPLECAPSANALQFLAGELSYEISFDELACEYLLFASHPPRCPIEAGVDPEVLEAAYLLGLDQRVCHDGYTSTARG